MTPANIPITIYQGATFRKSFQWLAGNPAVPVNLTSATGQMQIRRKVTSTDIELELTTTNGGIIITDSVNGKFELLVTPEQSSPLTIKEGVYDIELTVGIDLIRIIEGDVTLSKEVTR